MVKIVLLAFLFVILFVSACAAQPSPTSEEAVKGRAVAACEQACREALTAGRNLSVGPCLLDPILGEVTYPTELGYVTEVVRPLWVCDVAHDPRADVDNLRENQCDAWHNGTATHFVEVTPECEFIKAV